MNAITQQKLIAVSFSCLIGWAFTFLATNVFRDYATGLFIWLPIVMGITSTILFGYKYPDKKKTMRNLSFLALLIYCIGILALAIDGFVCLLMAAPLGFVLVYIGYLVGYHFFLKSKIKSNTSATIIILILSVPALMAFESIITVKNDIRSITTKIEIDAPPEIVWKNVIEFPELNEPTELIFKTGIAYPISANISGHGVGAIRNCNFSTGSFVEPITVWDEANLLRFDVIKQPEPMKEVSFYTNIHPPHLNGFWVSEQGQFKLTKLPNGHTLLEGTTWYKNKIKPEFYWAFWSDYIVHKIHERVLSHIKTQSEIKR